MKRKRESNININRALTLCIVLLAVFTLILFLIFLLKPLFYNEKSKVVGGSYDMYVTSYAVVNKYTQRMMQKEYKKINKMLPLLRQKSQKVYDTYANEIIANYQAVSISKIEIIDEQNYLVTYRISDTFENKVVIHFDKNGQTFQIYYDQRLQNVQ